MKILQVRFLNLNSLAGEWTIDFTRAEYTANGIFAITGPTGSGKTTLLDAVCLALYGRTPRLERISESTNEIMSRHTGVCFAEIDFETRKGRFRCHWSQRRAREKSTGKLQQPRHEIVDGLTGKVLENKIKDVAREVEAACGMDFDQFTRSVLLAQGGFAAFLQATTDERAPILEQITGTEIYSSISQKVHQRRNAEQQKLAVMEAEIGAVTLLSEEEERVIRDDLSEKTSRSEAIRKELETARISLSWLTGLAALTGEIESLQLQADHIRRSQREAEPDRIRLAKAKAASFLHGMYLQLSALRHTRKKEAEERETTLQGLANLMQCKEKTLQGRVRTQTLVTAARSALQTETAICRQARELDVKLREAGETQKNIEKEYDDLAGQTLAHEKILHAHDTDIDKINQELTSIRDYLRHNQADAGLLEDLAALLDLGKGAKRLAAKVKSLLEELGNRQTAARKARQETADAQMSHDSGAQGHASCLLRLDTVRKELTGLLEGRDPAELREEQEALAERCHLLERIGRIAKQIAVQKAELAELDKRRQAASAGLVEIDRRYRDLSERIALQQQVVEKQAQVVLLAGRIRGFEEERGRLADGSPCPLCGAVEHPYCTGSPVTNDDAELELQRLRHILQHLQDDAADLKAEAAAAGATADQAEKSREKILIRLTKDDQEHAELLACLPGLPDDIAAELVRWNTVRQQGRQRLKEIDTRLHQVESIKNEAERQKDTMNARFQELQKAVHAEAAVSEDCIRLREQSDQAQNDLQKSLEDAALRLNPYGIESVNADSLDAALAALSLRQHRWKQHRERERQIVSELQGLQIERERAKTMAEKLAAEREKTATRLLLAKGRSTTVAKTRYDLYQDKDPDIEEKQAADILEKAEFAVAAVDREIHRLEKDQAILVERRGSLDRSLIELSGQLGRQEDVFLQNIKDKGFADETEFLAADLSEERMAEMTAFLEGLGKKEAEVLTLLQSKRQSLSLESEKQLTELSAPDIKTLLEEKSAGLHTLQQAIGRLQGRLLDNDAQREKQHVRLAIRQQQQQEYRRWQALHELIGSSDGKKFRNFAQGVTFEIMIGHANHNLEKMTDRYILVRDTAQPLELNVIDTYQAGEIRSTKNLSGGESFIVSLALALGLAGMAGATVRVDSLFLDEGFGTLDEDALEIALETLACLQQEGKIIGIISHVPVLQDRIATRIQVIPGPSGVSRLQGPGVTSR